MAQRLNIDIVARDKSKQALGAVQRSLGRLRNSVFSLQSAFLGIGAGLVIRNLVNTGKNLENLRVRLKFLLKDTNEGAKAFENMTKFASKVPFSLEEIQSGSGILATVTDNADDLQDMLKITGNVAATTGLDFRTAAEQIQRSFSAGIGAADLFREKGVRNMLGFQAGATVSIEETRKAFARVFGEGGQFGRSTEELANTFEGTLSMIGDKIFNFKRVLLEAGLFEELKNQFGDLDDFLEKNAKDLDKIAIAVGKNLAQGMASVVQIGKDLIPTLKQIGSILKSIIDGFMALPPFIRTGGIIGAFLFGRKGLAALAGVSFVVDKINTMIKGIKTSMGIFDVTNVEDVQLRIDQIKRQLEELRQPDFFSNLGMEVGIDQKKIDALEKELELRQEQLKAAEDLQRLERAVFKDFRTSQFERMFFAKKTEESNKKLLDILRELTEKTLDDMNKKFENINTIVAKGILDGVKKISQSLAEAVVLGKNLFESFRALAQQILVNILAHLIEQVAIMGIAKILKQEEVDKEAEKDNLIRKQNTNLKRQIALQAILMAMGGGGGGGSGISLFAKGGAVSKGQPIVVGEQGAELFIPNQTGQITQSARGTGGGSTQVTFNINTLDASGFEDLLVRSRGTITSIINNAVNERGEGSLI